MQQHRFAPTIFFIWSGLLIYALEFLFVYVFAALACARRFTHVQWLGMPLVPLATTVSGALAVTAIGAVMWIAARRNRMEANTDEHTRFIRFLAIAGGGLSLLGLLWLMLPPLLLSSACTDR
jgi:hypothetical protein